MVGWKKDAELPQRAVARSQNEESLAQGTPIDERIMELEPRAETNIPSAQGDLSFEANLTSEEARCPRPLSRVRGNLFRLHQLEGREPSQPAAKPNASPRSRKRSRVERESVKNNAHDNCALHDYCSDFKATPEGFDEAIRKSLTKFFWSSFHGLLKTDPLLRELEEEGEMSILPIFRLQY